VTALFTHDLGDGLGLALREEWTVEPLHQLILENLDHLRPWEPWAHGEQSVDGFRIYTRGALTDWIEGRSLPAVILQDGAPIGVAGATIDAYLATAQLGYWIAARHQGRGAVTRAVAAILDHLSTTRAIQRTEIRTAVRNRRSRAVAERLGFTHEDTLRSALPIGDHRDDLAVYGLSPGSDPSRPGHPSRQHPRRDPEAVQGTGRSVVDNTNYAS